MRVPRNDRGVGAARPALADVSPWLVAAVFVPVYLGATLLGYAFYLTPRSVSVFWPASGVFVAALLVTRPSAWLALVPLSAACEWLAARIVADAGPVGFIGGSSQLEALIGVVLVRWTVGPRPDVSATRDLLRLVGAAVLLGPAIGALVGATLFVRHQPDVSFVSAWQVWWCADALGVLVVAPALLAWTTPPARRRPRAGRTETVAALLVLVAASWLVLGREPAPYRSLLDFPYVMFPLLLWIAFRLDTRGVTLGLLALALLAVGFADRECGPFVLTAGATIQANVLAIQAFLAAAAVSSLLLHASVTDRRRAHRARLDLQRSLLQLERLETLGHLAGTVAHDFANDLTVILSHADLLSQRDDLDARGRRAAEEIAQAAERSSKLVEQLLVVGRRQVQARVLLDPNALVRGLEETIRRVIGREIDLRLSYGSRGRIFSDGGQLEQALLNLVLNARDAMPAGGTLTIATRDAVLEEPPVPGLAHGPFVVIEVTDDGTGIPDEVLKHAFEPFFTTKPVGRGTGLGLASVFGVVRQHGGWIDVDTEVGAGTTFAVHLPRAEDERPGAPSAAGEGADTGSS